MTFVNPSRAAEMARELAARNAQTQRTQPAAPLPPLPGNPGATARPAQASQAAQTSQVRLQGLKTGQAEPVGMRLGPVGSVQRIQLNDPATYPAGHDPAAVQAVADAAPFGNGLDGALTQDSSYKGLPNLIEAFYPGSKVLGYSSGEALFENPAGQLSLARVITSGGLRLSATHLEVSVVPSAQTSLIELLYPNSTLVKQNDRVSVFVTEDGRALVAQLKLNPEALRPDADFFETRFVKQAHRQFVLDSAERLKALKQQGYTPSQTDLYLPEGFHPF